MQLIDNISVKDFNEKQKLLVMPDGYLLVNVNTANLIHCLQQSSSVEDARNIFCSSQNISIPLPDFENIVRQKLSSHGLIKNEPGHTGDNKKSFLKYKIVILPPRYAEYIARMFSWLFNPPLFWSVFGLAVIINFIHVLYLTNYISGSQNYFVVFLLFGLSTFVHEVGHISSSRYFGSKSGGVGFGFYLIWPVAYSDLSGVWEIEKKKRIIVNLAGIFLEYTYAIFLILLSIVFKLNVLNAVAAAIAIKATLQLNPFLRFDGYWVLSDLLSQPNLMSKASIAVKEYFRAIFFASQHTQPKQENSFILLYGIANVAIGFVFLGVIYVGYTEELLLFPQNTLNIARQAVRGENVFSLITFTYVTIFSFYILLFLRIKKICLNIIRHKSIILKRREE